MAAEKVQPVPWVCRVAMRGSGEFGEVAVGIENVDGVVFEMAALMRTARAPRAVMRWAASHFGD